MATEIKFSSGDVVFWLSSKGFKKGIIKQVILTDSVSVHNKKHTKRKEVRYLLWCDEYAEVYMGDEMKESEIFTSYPKMIAYYHNKKDF